MLRLLLLLVVMSFGFTGCTTNRTSDTARTGLEQILISNAVDQALDRIEMPQVTERKVFLDTQYLESAVDKGYLIGSLRRRLLNGGAILTEKKEDSELTIEVCSGCIGTDTTSSFFGLPGMAVPGPMPIQVPEVRLYERGAQYGTAKISLITYATETGQLLHDSGLTLARSDDSRWSVFGAGPFYSGSVRKELHQADSQATPSAAHVRMADNAEQSDSRYR